jgi:hypothetical protein
MNKQIQNSGENETDEPEKSSGNAERMPKQTFHS